MRVFWRCGALNLMPETEEEGAVTAALLSAFGTGDSDLGNVVLEVATDSRFDHANE